MNLEKQNVKIHASLPNKILIEPLVSICQVGCCKVLAWKLFQWFLYMSRVSQKKFELNRTMPRIQRPDIRFWSIYLLKMAKMA